MEGRKTGQSVSLEQGGGGGMPQTSGRWATTSCCCIMWSDLFPVQTDTLQETRQQTVSSCNPFCCGCFSIYSYESGQSLASWVEHTMWNKICCSSEFTALWQMDAIWWHHYNDILPVAMKAQFEAQHRGLALHICSISLLHISMGYMQ